MKIPTNPDADPMAAFKEDSDLKHIADGIRDLTLPKAEWTHAGHFAAAIWLLQEDGFDAYRELPDIIRAYNEATGVMNTDDDGYHETITQASLKAATGMLETADKDDTLTMVHARLMASEYGKADWLLTYWSKACLFSVEARHHWVAPDLKIPPFDL